MPNQPINQIIMVKFFIRVNPKVYLKEPIKLPLGVEISKCSFKVQGPNPPVSGRKRSQAERVTPCQFLNQTHP